MASIFDEGSALDGISGASVPGRRGARITDGTYWNRIETFKELKCRDGVNRLLVEMTVLRVVEDPKGQANAAGTLVSFMESPAGPAKDSFLGNVKAFLMGCGVPEADITKQKVFEIIQRGLLNGLVVKLCAQTGPQKKDPTKSFTYKNWLGPVSGPELVKAGVYTVEQVIEFQLSDEDELKAAGLLKDAA